jgi:hypothetical protein
MIEVSLTSYVHVLPIMVLHVKCVVIAAQGDGGALTEGPPEED